MTTLLARRRTADDGFTLLEIIVALGILMVVSLALLPLFISSVRSADVAKAQTQAKNLMQERVEQMRNLPFHVPYSTGAQYVDLLDIYFHDRENPSTNSFCSTAAFVTATSTYRCALDSTKVGFAGFSETIDTQFLDKDRNVVPPVATYTSLAGDSSLPTSSTDVPPAQTIGATITVTWSQYGKAKSYSTYTQIGAGAGTRPQTVAKLRSSAVAISSTVDDGTPATLGRFDAGLLTADAGISTGATARSVATGAYASLSSGETSANQATGSLDAPPDQPAFTVVDGTASAGVPCTSALVCFGPTQVSNLTGGTAGGRPVVGSNAAPATATLVRGGAAPDRGFWFSNVPTGTTQVALRNLLVQDLLVPPTSANPTQLVRTVQSSPSGGTNVPCGAAAASVLSADFVTSKGVINTTSGSTHSVSACTTATTRRVDIMPTAFAPDGILQVTLHRASLACTSSGAGSTGPVSDWAATVSYHNTSGGYTDLPVAKGSPDPLTTTLLTVAGPGGAQVGSVPGRVFWLGEYVKSWSSGTLNPGATTGTARQSDLTAVSISTVPTRDADTLGQSGINVAVGQLSCLAEDNR